MTPKRGLLALTRLTRLARLALPRLARLALSPRALALLAIPRVLLGPGARAEQVPSPATRFFEGGRVSQTLYGVSKTLFDST